MDSKHSGVATGAILWDKLHQMKLSINDLKEIGSEIGVLYMKNAKAGNCMYLVATEVNNSRLQEGFCNFTLPANEYLACGIEAESFAELYNSALYKEPMLSWQDG